MQEIQNMQLNYYIQLVLNSWTREQIQQFENYLDFHFYLQDFPSIYSALFDQKIKDELKNLERISDKSKIQIKKLNIFNQRIQNLNIKGSKNGKEISLSAVVTETKPSKVITQFLIIIMQLFFEDIFFSQKQKQQSMIQQQLNNIDEYEQFLEFLTKLLEFSKNSNAENEAKQLIEIILILIKYKPITVQILSENQSFIIVLFSLIKENLCCLEVLFLLNECWNKSNLNMIEKLQILDYYDELVAYQNIEQLPKYMYQIKLLLQNDTTLITEYLMKNQKNINESQINFKFEILYCLSEPNYEIGFQKFIRLFDKIEQSDLNSQDIRFILIFILTSLGKLNRSQLKCARFMLDKIYNSDSYNKLLTYLKNLLEYYFRIDIDGPEINKLLQSKSQTQLQGSSQNLINSSRQGSFSKKIEQKKLLTSSSYQQIMISNPNLQLVLSDKSDDFIINLQQSISILEAICLKVETDIEQTVRMSQKALGLICLFPFEDVLFLYCEEIFLSYNLQQLLTLSIDLERDEYQLQILTILSFYPDLFDEKQKNHISNKLNDILMSYIDQLTMTQALIIIKNMKFQEIYMLSLITLILNAEQNEVNEILIFQILLNQNLFEPPEQIIQQKFQHILPLALNQIKQNNFHCIILIKFGLILSIIQKFRYKFYSRTITESIFQSFKWFNVGLEEALHMIKFFGFIWHDSNSFHQQASNKLLGLIENTMKKIITQKEILYSQLSYSSIKTMMVTLQNVFVKPNQGGDQLQETFINLFATLTDITFSEQIQMKQFVKFCLLPALLALSTYINQKSLPIQINIQAKSLINLLQKEDQQQVKFDINFVILLFSTIETLVDDQVFCDIFCEFQDFEKCLKQIVYRRHNQDLSGLGDRILVKMQIQKPVEYNYAALLGESYEESKYYSVLKDDDQIPQQDVNEEIQDCKEQISNLKIQLESIKSLSQKQVKQDQLKYTFWIIEQNIINDKTAQYSHEIGLTNILIKYHYFKGALYCLSKVLSYSQEQQNIISQLGWQQLKLDKLSDEILEFLIQNSHIKAIQQLLFSQITNFTQFNADWSIKIKKKVFLCLNAFCRNHQIAERYYEQNLTEQILKNFTSAKSECILLVGSICLSQNAQSQLINTEIGNDIICCLNTSDTQLLANSYYALSGICYNQSYIQLKYINSEIPSLLASHLSIQSDIIVIEAISQLISNLTYNNNQAKQTLSKFIPALIQVALNFTQNINKEEWIANTKLKTLKSLLRALNNLIFLRENCIQALQNQMEDLCSIIFEYNIFCNEFFDILTNLGIHQQLRRDQVIKLNSLIQDSKAPKLTLNILDAINSASKQFCDMISQEFQLETYKNILIQDIDKPQTVLRIYRFVSNLLFNNKNYLYLEQCKFLSMINESSDTQIQHYYEKIQQQIGKTQHSQTLLGLTSPQQHLFTVNVVKGNLILQKALLNINQEEISLTQNGIKKNKYIITSLKEIINNVNNKVQEFKMLSKVANLSQNLCLCLIGSNKGQQNRIVFQTQNEEEKIKITECIKQFIQKNPQ